MAAIGPVYILDAPDSLPRRRSNASGSGLSSRTGEEIRVLATVNETAVFLRTYTAPLFVMEGHAVSRALIA